MIVLKTVMDRCYSGVLRAGVVASFLFSSAVGPSRALAVGEDPLPKIASATKEQIKILEQFQARLVGAGHVRADLRRKTVIGLLGQEKLAEGELLLSKGRVRMDLKSPDSGERHLLVVGSKSFWAATFPPTDLEGALVQVVTGPVKSKKRASAGFLAILGKDGFLKSFSVSGVSLDNDGGIRYYLQPKADWVEAKRALLALGPELGKSKKTSVRDFREIKIWDFQNNETQFTLGAVNFAKDEIGETKFDFKPPKNADVMTVPQ
jgi:hypothetical protein